MLTKAFTMRTLYVTLTVAVLAFLLGLAVFWGFQRSTASVTEQDATILVERVRKVTKLVTVEGDFNEVFNSANDREVTFYLPLPARMSFKKEAMVQVTGKVLVGYNLEQLGVTIDEERRTLRLTNLPEPEILAIDQELKFRDLEESWFNQLTADDYSAMSRQAKDVLREKVRTSELMETARLEGNSLIETIIVLARSMGYAVELEGRLVPEEPRG